MSGFCGWLAKEQDQDSAPALLARMVSTLPAGSQPRTDQAIFTGGGLALRGDFRECAWWQEDELCAAIIGYPRWSDPALTDLAHEHSQAAALLEAYRRFGLDLLSQLFGHFAFVILEPAAKRTFCAIDRFGVYRLCHAIPRHGDFAFATSADALCAVPGIGTTISPQTLYQYLYFIDRVAAPGTIYDEQSKLRPGEALLFQDGTLRCWRYWQLDYRHPSRATRTETHEKLRAQLTQAVERCVEGEDASRTSAFLSGGLDSSSVAGFLARTTAGKGRCVTIAFQHSDFDESHFAEIAARHFGLKHEVFMVGPREVLAVLPKLSTAYDEPYSNSSVIPCYYCARVSQEAGDEVILAGDGGDELFGGNTRYVKDGIFDYYRMIPPVLRNHLLEPALARRHLADAIPLLRRARSYVAQARRSVADRLTSHNAFAFAPPEHVFSPEACATIDPAEPRRFVEEIYDAALGGDKIQRMMHLDLQLTLADSDLRKVLTSCTIAGIRVRFPMLDDDLACFSATLPANLLAEGGKIRRFYKEALRDFLPQAVIDKPKQGFGLPMFQYVAESLELADFFCDALSDLKGRGFFNAAFLDQLIAEVHEGRPGTHSGIVWDLAVLETWIASRFNTSSGAASERSAAAALSARNL